MSYYKEVILASLLHDIGKFYQKAKVTDLDNRGKHPEISGRFVRKYAALFGRYVDVAVLEELVRRHHDNGQAFEKDLLAGEAPEEIRPYAQMISLADNLSSCERDEKSEGYTNYRTRPLNSVFGRLFCEDDSAVEYAYPVKPLAVNNIFPEKMGKNNDVDCQTQIKSFEFQIQRLEENPPADFQSFLVILDTILKQLLWCIPSSSFDKVSDVSLYDHMKTSAAIASVLYQYHEATGKKSKKDIYGKGENKFLLLEGTFSGIQKYIFAAATTNASGVAKRLRARSFYVDAMIGAIAQFFIDDFKLSRENILMLTGGKFCLLLPNYPGATGKIHSLTANIEKELFERFHGDIKICIAYREMNNDDFVKYSEVVKELSADLSEKKNHPFSTVLCANGTWQEDAFFLYDDLSNKTLCKTCRERVVEKKDDPEKEECSECRDHFRLGEMLVKAKYICYRYGKPDTGAPVWKLFGNHYLELTSEPGDPKNIYLMQQLNKEYVSPEDFCYPMQIKYLANNRAKDGEEILSFNDIAERSQGRKALGVLKADVDMLGFLFADGLRKGDRHYGTISRVSTMSHMLEMFFSGYVNALLIKSFPSAYCVFSGGDDLFLIAPWNELPKLSLFLQKKFTETTTANPHVTMSAAICIFPAKTHIALMAEESEQKLKAVKNIGNPELYPDHKGRNAVYFLGDILRWEDLLYVYSIAEKRLCPAMKDTGVNILRRIAKYSDAYRDFLKDKDIMKLMFEPMLTYDRKRNYKAAWKTKENTKAFWDYVCELTKNAAECANYKKDGVMKELYLAKTAVKYSMDLTKEDRND